LKIEEHNWKPHLVKGDEHAFTLLKLCLQIHAETALLPYSLNTFYFTEGSDIEVFFRSVSAPSIEAIKTLEVPLLWFTDHPESAPSRLVQCKSLGELGIYHDHVFPQSENLDGNVYWDLPNLLREHIPSVRTSVYDSVLGLGTYWSF
jgi:hypothetical protein